MARGRWLTLLVMIALVATACASATEKIAENAIEKAIESEGGGDVNVELGDDGQVSISVEGEDGSSFEVGKDIDLPEGLTIPIPDGGNATQTGTDGSYVFAALTYPTERYDEIVAFYNDWTDGTGEEWNRSESTLDMGEGLVQRSAQWVSGPTLIGVSDCFDIQSDGDGFDAICLTVNESL